jgi:hypothetical protein
MEVIVADASDTPLDPVYFLVLSQNVSVLRNTRIIMAPGLNLAAQHARGDYLAVVSAHCILPPNYVELMVDAARRTGAANVGARYVKKGRSAWGRAVAAATSSPFAVGGAPQHFGNRPRRIDSAFPGFISRKAFDGIGGFNPDLACNEDDEFNARLRARGEVVWYEASIGVVYRPRESLRGLWRQYYRYARWKIAIARLGVGEYLRPHHYVPALAVALAAATPLLALVSPLMAAATVTLGVAYSIVSMAEARRLSHPQRANPLRTWLVFPVLHCAYAFGFVRGLFDSGLPREENGLPPIGIREGSDVD